MNVVIKYLVLASVFYYLLSDIDIARFIDSFNEYSALYVFLAMLSVLLSDFVLGVRWRYLSHYQCSLLASFECIVISGLLNFILPAKLGELSKVVYLKKVYKLRISHGTQLVIFERLLDVLFLGVLASYVVVDLFNDVNIYLYYTVIVAVLGLLVMAIKSNWIISLTKKIPIQKLVTLLLEVKQGLSNQLNFNRVVKSLVLTFTVWVSFFITIYLFLNFSTNFQLSVEDIFVVFVISSIAMSIPLTPGGAGIYQVGIVYALGLYGIGQEEALAAGIMLHLILLIPSLLAAFFVLEWKGISLRGLKS